MYSCKIQMVGLPITLLHQDLILFRIMNSHRNLTMLCFHQTSISFPVDKYLNIEDGCLRGSIRRAVYSSMKQ